MLGKIISKQQKAVVFGSWFGWSLDGYDLVLMLFVISSVNQLFFPSNDPTLSLLATFATYTVALVMRPVGGAIFGNFGDKHGRKKAMIITILGFSIVTFLTGLLPVWSTVGVLAPILLIILRFAQGLFAGGEWARSHNGNSTKNNAWITFGICTERIFFWICNRITCLRVSTYCLSWTIIYRIGLESDVLHWNYTRITCLVHKA